MRSTKIIGPIQIYQSQPLGHGSTGKVFKGKFRNPNLCLSKSPQTQIELAVKVIPHFQRYQNEVTQYLFESQKQALNTLVHPSIVKCYGIFQDGRNSYLATQFIPGGTLKHYMAQNGKLKDKQAISLLKKLLDALKYLTSKRIVHRDLKPANIMIQEYTCSQTNQKTIHPVIIDFGFSERINCIHKPQMFYNVGSPSYMAPESYNFTKYSEKSDLWALGVVFYEILLGEPFDFSMKVEEFFNYTHEAIQKRLADKKSSLSVRSMKILRSILVADENLRLNVNQVISLIQKQESHLETYNLIKKKSPEIFRKNSPKFFEKSKDQTHNKNAFFDRKDFKSKQRQKWKIPSFLDKTKNESKVPTIEKLIKERSPKHKFTYFLKKDTEMIKTMKSQQLIKPMNFFEKVNRSTVQNMQPKNSQHQQQYNTCNQKNTMSMSITDTNCSSSGFIHNNTFASSDVKPFTKLVFNYKSNTSNSFSQYLSPTYQLQRKTSFFTMTG